MECDPSMDFCRMLFLALTHFTSDFIVKSSALVADATVGNEGEDCC